MIRKGELKVGDKIYWNVQPHPHYTVARVDDCVFDVVCDGERVNYLWKCSQYSYATKVEETKMEVRAADKWRAGDMAYCLDSGGNVSRGDLLKVTEATECYIKFGPGRPGEFVGPFRYARVLTREEIKNLPAKSRVVFIRGKYGGYRAGHECYTELFFYKNNEEEDLNLYCALVSLPESKQAAAQAAIVEARDEIRKAEEALAQAKAKLDKAQLDGAF